MADPLVTVIIATYNKKSTLKYAVESVLWQTMKDFELWVIGDGCTDGTEELMATFDNPRVNWYNLPQNTGDQSEPSNEGLRRAKGTYISYLNHDDIWMPNHLEVLLDTIQTHNADFAYSIMEWIYDENDPLPENFTQPVAPHYPDSPFPPEATQTMHRKDVINDIGYWKRPWEVYTFPRADYFMRAQFNGKKFVLAPRLTALKLHVYTRDYTRATDQPEIMDRIKNDPEFLEKEMGKMVADIWYRNEKPVSWRRFNFGVYYAVRKWLIKRKIDPARIKFWKKPGKRMREWRKNFNLDPDVLKGED